MILQALFELIFAVLKVLFGWLNLPDMPEEIIVYVDDMVNYIVEALPIIWCFLDKKVVAVCLSVSLACMNFEKIYYFLMWIVAKIRLAKD